VRALLLAVGLSEKQISALVLRCPRAMLHNPVLLAVKLAGFKVCCKLLHTFKCVVGPNRFHNGFVSLNHHLRPEARSLSTDLHAVKQERSSMACGDMSTQHLTHQQMSYQ
jgi:hypothetical protein